MFSKLKKFLPEKGRDVQFSCESCGRGKSVRVKESKLETVIVWGGGATPCECGALMYAQAYNERLEAQAAESSEWKAKVAQERCNVSKLWGFNDGVQDGMTYLDCELVQFLTMDDPPILAVVRIPSKNREYLAFWGGESWQRGNRDNYANQVIKETAPPWDGRLSAEQK